MVEMTLSAAGRERMATRAVTAAVIGTALEWFDFTLYGAVSATVLPKLFFPTLDPTAALLASLATFGVGLGARPLGAIVCGYLGDKFGRRNLLLGSRHRHGTGIRSDRSASYLREHRRDSPDPPRSPAYHSRVRARR